MAAGLALGVALTLLSWLVRDKSAATAAAMSHVLEAASLGKLSTRGSGWRTGGALLHVWYRVR